MKPEVDLDATLLELRSLVKRFSEVFPTAYSTQCLEESQFDVTLVEDFLRAFSTNALATVHVCVEAGSNPHHVAETVFKALAIALDRASSGDERRSDIPSTKGTI